MFIVFLQFFFFNSSIEFFTLIRILVLLPFTKITTDLAVCVYVLIMLRHGSAQRLKTLLPTQCLASHAVLTHSHLIGKCVHISLTASPGASGDGTEAVCGITCALAGVDAGFDAGDYGSCVVGGRVTAVFLEGGCCGQGPILGERGGGVLREDKRGWRKK